MALALLCPLSPFKLALDDCADEFRACFLLTQHGIDARQRSTPEPCRSLFLVDSLASHESNVRQNTSSGQLRISTRLTHLADIHYR